MELTNLQNSLQQVNATDENSLDLQILILQLQQKMQVAAFDPLKELNSIPMADTAQLQQLIAQAQQAIDDESNRAALVGKIVATTQIALKASGISIGI